MFLLVQVYGFFPQRFWLAVVWLMVCFSAVANADNSADTLTLNRFDANAPYAQVLWIPSEKGVLPQEIQLAKQLKAKHISVMMPDLFDSYFLPAAPSSLQKISPQVIANLIEKRQAESPQLPLFVIAPNRAAALAIKALIHVEQTPVRNIGLILLNPNLYVKTPEAGKTAEYWPSVSRLNLPVMVMQAALSPWRWHLPTLDQRLSTGGSDVFIKVLPKVRDRYYFRPDAMRFEQKRAEQLPQELLSAMALMSPYLSQSRQVGKATVAAAKKPPPLLPMSVGEGLPKYQGAQNRKLVLQGMNGKTFDLNAYKGKVILLNFWASWCPPCVHEMPSMAQLKTHLKGQPFEILAANLAEEKPAIEAFLKAHPVNFPILMDPKGSAVKEWKVFAYPSSYLIDKQGKIRYALFGGYDWASPTALKTIKNLLKE